VSDAPTAQAVAPSAALQAVPRSGWHVATVAATHRETPNATRIELDVPGWPGNAAGQHLDVRLTAPDGYQATRSYSIASSGSSTRVVLAVDKLPDGEVSPYLVDDVRHGDSFELRGPIGGYFAWEPADGGPLLLVGGGSGVVPLRSMLRARTSDVPARLIYSARTLDDVIYRDELSALGDDVLLTLTREQREGVRAGRVDADLLREAGFAAADDPRVFVCGPTPFVEAVASSLVELGHAPERIRTERFGPTGR
jgi:ferredoxin-NADP reductase